VALSPLKKQMSCVFFSIAFFRELQKLIFMVVNEEKEAPHIIENHLLGIRYITENENSCTFYSVF
jgi:hypothetical protein